MKHFSLSLRLSFVIVLFSSLSPFFCNILNFQFSELLSRLRARSHRFRQARLHHNHQSQQHRSRQESASVSSYMAQPPHAPHAQWLDRWFVGTFLTSVSVGVLRNAIAALMGEEPEI